MPQVASVRRKGRSVSVDFADDSSLHCDRDFLPGRRLAAGQTIEQPILERLREQAARHDAERSVLRWLAPRPRSRADLLRRLRAKGVPQAVAHETLDGLAAQGLLDDGAFAQSWVESRLRKQPRSRAMIRSELRAQGVAAALAEDATRDIDDQPIADTIAAGQVGRSIARGDDWESFRRRTGALLERRGFAYAVAQPALRAAWAGGHSPSRAPTIPQPADSTGLGRLSDR